MSRRLPKNGVVTLTIVAADRIAAWSKAPFTVYQLLGFPNVPSVWTVLQEVAAETEYRSAAFATGATLRIEAGGADVLYAAGVVSVITERIGLRAQGAPGVLNATGALTSALITTGIVTSTNAAVIATLDTGAVSETALDMQIGESFDWSVVKTAANTFTVTSPDASHVLEGSGVVAATSSASFRTRKTALDTFITTRLG